MCLTKILRIENGCHWFDSNRIEICVAQSGRAPKKNALCNVSSVKFK